jgi:hypothetical protein
MSTFKRAWPRLAAALGLALTLGISSSSARADVIYEFSFEFSGATSPVGPPPWLRATFAQGADANTVELTLEATGLSGSEFVS